MFCCTFLSARSTACGVQLHSASSSSLFSWKPIFLKGLAFRVFLQRSKDRRGAEQIRRRDERGWTVQCALARVRAQLPVVHLRRVRVSRRVVVHLDQLWEVVAHDFGDEDTIRKVSRNVPLWSRERDVVDPLVDALQFLIVHHRTARKPPPSR